MAGERRHVLVAGREQHPPGEIQIGSNLVYRVDRDRLVAKLSHVDRARRVPREPRHRPFIVHDAGGDGMPSQAPDDSQPLIVAADNHSAHRPLQLHLQLPRAVTVAGSSSPS